MRICKMWNNQAKQNPLAQRSAAVLLGVVAADVGSIGFTIGFHNKGEGPYFSWLKAATTAFTFK